MHLTAEPGGRFDPDRGEALQMAELRSRRRSAATVTAVITEEGLGTYDRRRSHRSSNQKYTQNPS